MAQKTSIFALALCLACFGFVSSAMSQGYEWVQPGTYRFGSCGHVNGGEVPATIGSGKFYSQGSCLLTYGGGLDACGTHASQIRGAQYQYDTVSQCAGWLNNETMKCRRYMASAVEWCYRLGR